jgi:hypothetical protein
MATAMTALLLILYIIAAIATGAVADGLNDTNRKKVGHLSEAVEIALALSGAVIFHVEWNTYAAYIIAYIGFRIALFDFIYNISSYRKLLDVGNSNWWDELVSKVLPAGMFFIRLLFLGLATGLAFKFF